MFDHFGDKKEETLQGMTISPNWRAGSSEEVAAGILFVIQNEFVTGTTVDVDGGRLLS